MNAVMRKYELEESAPMPTNERDDQAIQIAELRADVRHIQSDTTEIKADLRVTNQRIDSLAQRTDEQIRNLGQKIDERHESLRQWAEDRFDKVEERFDKKFDDLKDALSSAKIWALGLYIALAGSMFYVLARGFKWL